MLMEARSVCEAAEGLLRPAGQGGFIPSHRSFCFREHIWHCSFSLCISKTEGEHIKNHSGDVGTEELRGVDLELLLC